MAGTATILGIGAYRPAQVLTNHEIAQRVDTNDEWIRERTGIQERRVAGEGESIVEMAAAASSKALAAAGIEPSAVDLVILATCSATDNLPGGAAGVATLLGANAPGAFDLNAACAGFSYGLGLARDAVNAGSAKNVVVVGSERLVDWLDWEDRTTCILFGDGAGAAVVGCSDTETFGIGPTVWGSDGTGSEFISLRDGTLSMEGPAVFRWATSKIAPIAREACEAAGVSIADINAFVPHQANGRIIAGMARALGFADSTVIANDVSMSGNTSSASIPLALAALQEQGQLAPGSLALLVGFGSGLTYAAQVVRIP